MKLPPSFASSGRPFGKSCHRPGSCFALFNINMSWLLVAADSDALAKLSLPSLSPFVRSVSFLSWFSPLFLSTVYASDTHHGGSSNIPISSPATTLLYSSDIFCTLATRLATLQSGVPGLHAIEDIWTHRTDKSLPLTS